MGEALQRSRLKHFLFLLFLVLLLLVFALWGISQGSSSLSFSEVLNTLSGQGSQVARQVVINIRLPRVLAAIVTGAALSVSGAVIQTVIRNPLGSPFTLGLSAASAFGAAFAIVVAGALGAQMSGVWSGISEIPWIVTLSAFVFGMLCALLIAGFARWRGATPEILVMAGIILTSLFQSGTSLLQYISTDV